MVIMGMISIGARRRRRKAVPFGTLIERCRSLCRSRTLVESDAFLSISYTLIETSDDRQKGVRKSVLRIGNPMPLPEIDLLCEK